MFPTNTVNKIKSRFISNNLFPPENRASFDVTRTNMVEADRAQMTIWRVRSACWVTKATNTLKTMKYLLVFRGNNV